MGKHTVLAAAVVFGLTLVSCGTSSASGTAPASTSSYCTVYRATTGKIDAAYGQITPTANAETVHSAFDTIVAQFKTAMNSSPPAAIKNDLQAVHNAVVEAERQLAAVSYNLTQLPDGPPAINNPEFQRAARNITQWAKTNCSTPLPTGSAPPVGPTR